jgi:hypothetical protein
LVANHGHSFPGLMLAAIHPAVVQRPKTEFG